MSRAAILLLIAGPLCPFGQAQLAPGNWKTDLTKHSVDLAQFVTAGRKDGIRSIDHPKFVTPDEASKWLHEREPVVVTVVNGEARAYPVQLLIWHLLVNDQIGQTPVLVTYSVFSQTAEVFDRRAGDTTHQFGFAGMMRNSNFVMFDRETESLWQQLTGEAVVGSLTGTSLGVLYSQIAPFNVFRKSFPTGQVLSRDTGFNRKYGQNPYARYLSDGKLRFPVQLDGTLPVPAMEGVIAVQAGGSSKVYPDSLLARHHVYQDKIGDHRIVILSDESMLSTRDSLELAQAGKETAAGVFSPVVDGRSLSFRYNAGNFTDKQTGSAWTLLGTAVSGPLAGKQLKPIPHTQALAFAWLAFHPETQVMGGGGGGSVPQAGDPLYPNTIPTPNPDPRNQNNRRTGTPNPPPF